VCHCFGVHLANRQEIANPAKPPVPRSRRCSNSLCSRHNTPSPNDVVSVPGKQGLTIRTPCQADTLRLSALLANSLELWLQLIDLALLLQIKDYDAAGGGSAEPVSVGGEDKGVDLITGVQGVEVLRLVQVPQHGSSVLSARCAKGSIGGDGDSVDVAAVSDVVGLQSAGGELPDLYSNLALLQQEFDGKAAYEKIKIRALVLGCLMAWSPRL
jgi:hypothetical protein